ncbi:trehalase-like isoform X2 [Cotesia glomerata]|uniref:trehalase-like isoform X2 n=1 Tax=Cotesia glomerata TaxID=32391 RepID=UPI001D013524|nr:trehalase-like isoform X2 [Cotesia glomerata]
MLIVQQTRGIASANSVIRCFYCAKNFHKSTSKKIKDSKILRDVQLFDIRCSKINEKLLRYQLLDSRKNVALLKQKPSRKLRKSPGSNFNPITRNNIYCHGDLLHEVQMSRIFPDSKTFVDMKMKHSPEETLKKFETMMSHIKERPPPLEEIKRFVEDNFDEAGSEFEDWNPVDWRKEPKFLKSIKDPNLRKFASDLNDIWKLLGRKMKEDVRINQDLYSILYVPHPVIVPGGRFREFYYWDSYWIIKGLLLSEMHATVRGMLTNFVSIVKQIGFIPNGGRIYYTMRSQPPMLTPMVKIYIDDTNDTEWLKENLWLLEKEFDFWMTNRTVKVEKDGRNYTLARYYENSSGPRPESYREDIMAAENLRSEEKEEYYKEIKSAAESGWDFSSRWFILDGTNKGNLSNLKTRYIVPVDLNAIIYRNAILLAEFNEMIGNFDKAAKYRQIAEEWKEAIDAVLWHDDVGAWLDYDILNGVKRDYFYPTNILPLWTECYDITKREYYVDKALKYLDKSQIMLNLGGIPATFEHSGEQWDYPNAWPPLQYFVIMALDNCNDIHAQKLAYELSEIWVRSNYKAFKANHSMFEKYDATVSGSGGGGGEYTVQLGFGWSNGLILDLLNKYHSTLSADSRFIPTMLDDSPSDLENLIPNTVSGVSTAGQMMTALLALIITIAAGFIG